MFSRGNKNKLRNFSLKNEKKIKNSQPQRNFTGSYKKKSISVFHTSAENLGTKKL